MESTLHLSIIILCLTVESVLNGIDGTLIHYNFVSVSTKEYTSSTLHVFIIRLGRMKLQVHVMM